MKGLVLLVLLGGCGVLEGSGDQPVFATLHLFVTADPAANEATKPALVWYDGAASALLPAAFRTTSPYAFDIDLLALPPETTLVSDGARRIAIGQLVFYADANDAPPMLDSGQTVVGAPVNAALFYLEGPAIGQNEADPSGLLVGGAQPGFNWVTVPGGSPCTPTVEPVSTTIDFAFVTVDPASAPSLCSAPAALPACSATPVPTLPECP